MKLYIRRFEKSIFISSPGFDISKLNQITGRDNKLAAEALVDFLTRNPELKMAGTYVVEVKEKLFGGSDYNVFYKIS